MRFSICILAYNSVSYIKQCIQSCIDQSYCPYEILISDDCSEDETGLIIEEVLKLNPKINIKVFFQDRNLGIANNTKFLINKAVGDFIFLVAGDDYIEVNFLRSYYEILKTENSLEKIFFIVDKQYELINNIVHVNKSSYNKNKCFLKNAIRKNGSFIKCGISRDLLLGSYYPDDVGIWGDWVWDVSIGINHPDLKVLINPIPGYIHRNGSGISAITNSLQINQSYSLAGERILTQFSEKISWMDKMYLYCELSGVKYALSNRLRDYLIYLILFLINIGNFQSLVAFKSALSRLLPKSLYK